MNKKNKIIISVLVALVILLVVALVVVFLKKQKTVIIPAEKIVIQDSDTPAWQDQKQGGAKVWLETDSVDLSVGEEFHVSVFINTDSKNIVLAAIELQFDPDLVEVLDRKFEESDFQMSILNEYRDGILRIARGNAGDTDWLDSDDGFTGEDGLIADLHLKALGEGTVEFKFLDPDVQKKNVGTVFLLDDGQSSILGAEKNNLKININ